MSKCSPTIEAAAPTQNIHMLERSYVMSKQYQNMRTKSNTKIYLEDSKRNMQLHKDQINAVKCGSAMSNGYRSKDSSLKKAFISPSSNKENIPFPVHVKPSSKIIPIRVQTMIHDNSSSTNNDLFNSVLEDIEKTNESKPQTAQPKVCHSNIFTQPILKLYTTEL